MAFPESIDTERNSYKLLKLAFTYDRYSDRLKEGIAPENCLEFQSESAIEDLATALRKLGTVEMVGGIKSLTKFLASAKLDWDLVFNFAEGYGTVGREAQVPALLEAYGIPFAFSDSAVMALCMDKAKAKMVCEHFRIPTAPFASIQPRNTWPRSGFNPLAAIESSVHAEALKTFPLFVKPATISSGIGIGKINKVNNSEDLAKAIEEVSSQYPMHALLVETFLSGKEFTVSILGSGDQARVLGVRELVFVSEGGLPPNSTYTVDKNEEYFQQNVYGIGNKFGMDMSRPNPWPRDMDLNDPESKTITKVALNAWKALGCRDAGRVDIRLDTKDPLKAVPNFIEVNTLPGMIRGRSDFVRMAEHHGIEYDELVGMIVEQALKRYR
ncbi:D-ala D-ala ligase C-terminus-domain-containing protein [Crepidotus variabilis]|uniref:D-ala D-ala ligase C-terminus-domain-containing protein n=1 Tax=Crepidotus variabilis TaxID=179855 RepID=A0A9P6JU07_9AGAR|nr:D-ala D-ala ligase C-terminus-domain-containing protein [Crepidotus variabilis]